eukprot:315913-Rhodomonas_salina.1
MPLAHPTDPVGREPKGGGADQDRREQHVVAEHQARDPRGEVHGPDGPEQHDEDPRAPLVEAKDGEDEHREAPEDASHARVDVGEDPHDVQRHLHLGSTRFGNRRRLVRPPRRPRLLDVLSRRADRNPLDSVQRAREPEDHRVCGDAASGLEVDGVDCRWLFLPQHQRVLHPVCRDRHERDRHLAPRPPHAELLEDRRLRNDVG